MEFRHQFVDTTRYQRVFVVGDIHGKLDCFKSALTAIGFNPSTDLVIAVGDLIDRGPQSAETLTFLATHPWFISVAGNHELMMSNAMSVWTKRDRSPEQQRLIDIWFKNGADWTKAYSYEELVALNEVVESMPCAMTCLLSDGRTVGISHAQPHSLDWTEMQQWQGDMRVNPRWIWGRTRIKGEPAGVVENVDLTIHGHTRSEHVVHVANSQFIDTASMDDYRGPFTFLELNSGEYYPYRQDSEVN
ncbi:metallophosphoesterase [Thaumasiovibrio subtropicus]|uniref:metallophosphoesterase n=1 Tax=Thaumasiovibrio subtropicus TaxID=1891207 RepID=UPI000B35A42F|nr:metallophosphoesterase [Thaumasiovibrio subtropicus]